MQLQRKMPTALSAVSPDAAAISLAAGVSVFEAYVLYKVWTSRGEKDWPWYLLGAAVGANILLKVVAAARA